MFQGRDENWLEFDKGATIPSLGGGGGGGWNIFEKKKYWDWIFMK